MRWDEAGDDHWSLLLRCAECETYRETVVHDDVAQRYKLDLERGGAEIASTLKRLDRLHMLALLDTLHHRTRARPHRRRGLRATLNAGQNGHITHSGR